MLIDNKTLKDFRINLDRKYIGFSVNSSSIKPVHVANGLFRTILGKAYNLDNIGKFSYTKSNKGTTPPQTKLNKIHKEYVEANKIETQNITKEQFELLRQTSQSIVEADKGVYGFKGNEMVSYTLPSKYFLTTSPTHTISGEFMGSLLKRTNSKINKITTDALDDENDPITLLFYPAINLEEPSPIIIEGMDLDSIEGFKNGYFNEFINSLTKSFDCLAENLSVHPNKYVRLRQINFLAIYYIILYISNLEYTYKLTDIKRPFLLDCSSDSKSEVAKASALCISQINQSMSRCYSRFIANELRDLPFHKDFIKDVLESDDVPQYDNKQQKKENKQAFHDIWARAKENAKNSDSEDDMLLALGSGIYNMLEIEGSSTIIKYLKALGIKAGIIYPQANSVPNKRFVLATETLEVVLKSCIEPNKSITLDELLDTLWERFNIIVGGRSKDEELLLQTGIYHADSDSLKDNQKHFVELLERMNFAEIMADGILQIKSGGE